MKINRKNIKEVWVDYEDDVKFKIRPYPLSMGVPKNLTDGKVLTDFVFNRLMYCVVGWEGLVEEDENGNEIVYEYNEENKKDLFDYDADLMFFISSKIDEISLNVIQKKKK